MPLLGGIFNKRDKQNNSSTARNVSNAHSTATESVASFASTRDSTDADYVIPDKSLPRPGGIYSLPAAASSSKLKLPFRRKQQTFPSGTRDTPQTVVSLNDAPGPSYISGVVSDSGHGLPPPPPKSSIFGVYNDRNVLSTHSLPNDSTPQSVRLDTPSTSSSYDVRSETDSNSPSSPPAPPPKKSGGLFSWARERTKSKASQPPPTISSPPVPSPGTDDSSFNLKAFRHVRSDSPAGSPETQDSASSDFPLPPPRPRPRGDSVASDSSQRISVAAFREAQARRSRANSPVPSFRPPSAADTLRLDGNGRKRASTVSAVSSAEPPQPIRSSTAPMPAVRPNSSALQSSSSDNSESEDDEEVDSDGEPIQKPVRKRTITRRVGGARARSEAGHGSVHESSLPRPEPPRWSKSEALYMNQPDHPLAARTRASASTSALTPNAAARRASVMASANAAVGLPVQTQAASQKARKDDDSDTSSNSSNNDSEDMPLSTLVAPKRPGSSASVATNQSGGRPRMPAKPLIDIKSLVGSPPLLTPILRHEDSVKNLSAKGNERDINMDEPFSPPPSLALSPGLMSQSSSPSPMSRKNPAGGSKPSPPSHHRKASSEVPAIPVPKAADSDDDLMAAIRLVSSFDKERERAKSPTSPPLPSVPAPAPEASSSQPDATPADHIVPTPIRERKPPTSFSVVSRPPQRTSTADTSASLSSPTSSKSPPPSSAVPLKSAISSRPRSSTTVNASSQNDRSDAISVVSASQSSVSRSSRIPPVPLIDSIPDSPSVKADYRPGQPPSRSRVTSPSSSNSRSHPSSSTLVSLMPTSSSNVISPSRSPPSLMPYRPFASNSSLRGDSPAGSSTGDSSSGRGAPFTPRDGSEIGVRNREDGSDVGSTLKPRGHAKRSSVTFEDQQPVRGRERAKTEISDEERTRERRRNEARAAIELGKIVNGRGPLVRDDSDDDLVLRGRNPRISVAPAGMENGMPGMIPPGWAAWQQPMATGMNPMVAPQFSNDPTFMAAHQRALLIAKQAYQMAVAQHAMAVAGDEWERGSTVGGFGSGGSVYGGGSGGSVYGGMSGGGGGGGGMGPMSMMGMPGMGGMLMPPNQWSTGSVMFPSSASVYGGISSSQSEFGGGGGGWGSRSVYGDSFGPSSSRSSYMPSGHAVPSSSATSYGGPSRPRARTGAAPPSSSSSGLQTRSPGRSPARGRVAPPSSWKSTR